MKVFYDKDTDLKLIKATNDVAHVLPTDMVNSLPNGDPERFIELEHAEGIAARQQTVRFRV